MEPCSYCRDSNSDCDSNLEEEEAGGEKMADVVFLLR